MCATWYLNIDKYYTEVLAGYLIRYSELTTGWTVRDRIPVGGRILFGIANELLAGRSGIESQWEVVSYSV